VHKVVFHVIAASAKINNLLKEKMYKGTSTLKDILHSCRKVTICLDGWSKKGLTSSFLGISACFFCLRTSKPVHAFLNLNNIEHPHTGEMISEQLHRSLAQWGIEVDKVLLIITDNGANMVKAVRLLGETAISANADGVIEEEEEEALDLVDDNYDNQADESDDHVNFESLDVPFRRMGCLAHTLQLVIKKAYSGHYKALLDKARGIVGKVRKSSVMMEKIVSMCGKCVISDNGTRWNSTYFMAQRLIEVKIPLNEILAEMKIDSLLTSEWGQLDELLALLEPFAVQTDVLQTDAMSLSNIIPSVLNLAYHLEEFPHAKLLTNAILIDLKKRFSIILEADNPSFNPLPAAACLLDPSCAKYLLGFDQSIISLRDGAKIYILSQVSAPPLYGTS
jgi:hypothetical protein